MNRYVLLVTAMALMCVPHAASGATIRVPADYPTIQKGIDNATHGDTVLVAPGTYTGSGNRALDFAGTNLLLVSVGGAEVTKIDCESLDRGFMFHSGEDTSAVVHGFTVTNGQASSGGAVSIDGDSAPRFEECVFSSNSASAGGAVSLACYYGWRPAFASCDFIDNVAVGCGGAVHCWDSEPTIRDCEFVGNGASTGGGMYIATLGAFPIIRSCKFISNDVSWDGGGILVENYISSSLVTQAGSSGREVGARQFWNPALDCLFDGNRAGRFGGGICCFDNVGGSYLEIIGATFVGNYAPEGGGIADMTAAILISDCTFLRNSADRGGGILEYHWCPQQGITNCTFVLNGAPEGACVSWGSSSNRLMSKNIFAFSTEGAAVHCPSGDPIITHSVVFGNAGGDSLCGSHSDNLFVNPLFCGIQDDDVTLCADSPCLPEGTGWGELLGAHGQGCGACGVPVQPLSWGSIKAKYRWHRGRLPN